MKLLFVNYRRLFVLLTVLVFSLSAKADPGAEEVSARVLQHFASSFTTATNVTWKVTKQFSKASFTVNNRQTEVFYNRRNKLIGTAVCIKLQELPAGAIEDIQREYANYEPRLAIQYTNARGETSYFVQMENDKAKVILQVDEEGTTDCVKSERK